MVMGLTAFMKFDLMRWISRPDFINNLVDVIFVDIIAIKEGNSFAFIGLGFLQQIQTGFFDAGCRKNHFSIEDGDDFTFFDIHAVDFDTCGWQW